MQQAVYIDLSDGEPAKVSIGASVNKRRLRTEGALVKRGKPESQASGMQTPATVTQHAQSAGSTLSEEQRERMERNKQAALAKRKAVAEQSERVFGPVVGDWRTTKRCFPPEIGSPSTQGAGFLVTPSPPGPRKNLDTEGLVYSKTTTPPTSAAQLPQQKVTLSRQQLSVLAALKNGTSIFLTGSAGTGKSLLLNYAIRFLQVKYGANSVYVTASTGIAAVNIGGTTLHTFAGVGLAQEPKEVLVDKVLRRREAVSRWMSAKALILDEISMIDGEFLDKVEYVAQVVRRNQKPFGGIQLLVAGDFFQLPPVKLKSFAFEAECWKRCIQLQVELTHVFRQANEAFVKILNEVRLGQCSPQTRSVLQSCFHTVIPSGDGVMLTKLYPHKVDVKRENDQNMRQLNGERVDFIARDSAVNQFSAKQLENFRAEKHLVLCPGAQVMLIKNLNPGIGLANGARGVVVGFTKADDDSTLEYRSRFSDIAPAGRWPIVQFACMTEPMVVAPEDENVMEGDRELCKRQQVPLVLAWALSVHKCQGMTLDRVETDLSKAFDYGMCYVALSRAKSLEGLRLLGFDPSKIKVHEKVVKFYNEFSKGP